MMILGIQTGMLGLKVQKLFMTIHLREIGGLATRKWIEKRVMEKSNSKTQIKDMVIKLLEELVPISQVTTE